MRHRSRNRSRSCKPNSTNYPALLPLRRPSSSPNLPGEKSARRGLPGFGRLKRPGGRRSRRPENSCLLPKRIGHHSIYFRVPTMTAPVAALNICAPISLPALNFTMARAGIGTSITGRWGLRPTRALWDLHLEHAEFQIARSIASQQANQQQMTGSRILGTSYSCRHEFNDESFCMRYGTVGSRQFVFKLPIRQPARLIWLRQPPIHPLRPTRAMDFSTALIIAAGMTKAIFQNRFWWMIPVWKSMKPVLTGYTRRQIANTATLLQPRWRKALA